MLGKYPEIRARNIFLQVASALSYLHDHAIIHRDLKAENVFFTGRDEVVVGDFGFATRVDSIEQVIFFQLKPNQTSSPASDHLLRLTSLCCSGTFCWGPLPWACRRYMGAWHPPVLSDHRHNAVSGTNCGESEGSHFRGALLLPSFSLSSLPKSYLRHPQAEVKLQDEHGPDHRPPLAGGMSLAKWGPRLQTISSNRCRKSFQQWKGGFPGAFRTWCQHKAAQTGDGPRRKKPGHCGLQDDDASHLDQQQQQCDQLQQESEQRLGSNT